MSLLESSKVGEVLWEGLSVLGQRLQRLLVLFRDFILMLFGQLIASAEVIWDCTFMVRTRVILE